MAYYLCFGWSKAFFTVSKYPNLFCKLWNILVPFLGYLPWHRSVCFCGLCVFCVPYGTVGTRRVFCFALSPTRLWRSGHECNDEESCNSRMCMRCSRRLEGGSKCCFVFVQWMFILLLFVWRRWGIFFSEICGLGEWFCDPRSWQFFIDAILMVFSFSRSWSRHGHPASFVLEISYIYGVGNFAINHLIVPFGWRLSAIFPGSSICCFWSFSNAWSTSWRWTNCFC